MTEPDPPPRTVALCAIVKDEAEGLAEWIAYHSVIGVDRFVLFDNGSRDGTPELIRDIARHLPIDLFPWSSPTALDAGLKTLDYATLYEFFTNSERYPVADWAKLIALSPQMTAYNYALQRFGGETEWMMFLDADEFLVPLEDHSIHDYLDRFDDPEISAICINVKYFGSAGLIRADARPVIERFTRCAPLQFDGHTHVKSIVRPRAMDRMLIHSGKIKSGRFVNDAGLPVQLTNFGVSDAISMRLAQINHYSVKSLEEFQKKKTRGRAQLADDHPNKFDKGDEYFARQDRNEESDASILRFLEEQLRVAGMWR